VALFDPFSGRGFPHSRGFTITLRHTTLGRIPLDQWSDRRRNLYLTTHNTHKRQTSMPPAEFEPTIPASERPKTHALDRAATAIGQHERLIDCISVSETRRQQHILGTYLFSLYRKRYKFLCVCHYDSEENWNMSTNFSKNQQYEISQKFFQ
jgi:hypothetical protein